MAEPAIQIESLTPAQAHERQRAGATLVDVRESHERAVGRAAGALGVSRGELEAAPASALPDRAAPVVLICQGGRRSLLCAQALAAAGYTALASVEGGTEAWIAAGLPVERDAHDLDFARESGIRIVTIEALYDLGIDAVIAEARRFAGDGPTYVSFDVDGLDPVYAPGTGTPEIGGFTTHEAQRMIRGLQGLDLIGGDVVEVSPPFDPSGNTALVGATMMFEILCLLAEARSRRGR